MKNTYSLIMSLIMITMTVFGLQACSNDKKNAKHTIKVTANAFTNTLFYSGTIQPFKTIVVPSPADGVVIDRPFQYGDKVKAGQLLFMLSSEKFLTDYKTALMQYVKIKNDFNTSQAQLTEAKFLHKNQLISDDDLKTKQSNYYAARLGLLQAKDSLEIFLKQMDIKNIDLYKLTIADIDKITEAMHLQISSEKYLRVLSPAEGTILSPSKSEEENKKITKGDNVKVGDVLAIIGDMHGLSVRIKVDELSINQLHLQQKVKITGIAFPDHILNGEITRVDRQGDSSNGLPTFIIEVAVPALTVIQQKEIHVGMSAKVEVDISGESQITIPITAIIEKNGEAYVETYDEKNKQYKLAAVKTGKTTPDSIVILSGLKEGDNIVVPN